MNQIEQARLTLNQHNAVRKNLVDQVEQIAPNVKREHIGDVFDALWLLQKIEFK